MGHFFAAPTDEWGNHAVKLTPAGILAVATVIALLILIAMGANYRRSRSRRITTKQLVFSSAAIALAMVTSMIKLFEMPLGGSVTLLSMLFLALIGYWYGPYAGIMTAAAYGLLQFAMEPIFYTLPQMLTDYPLAFGALGLSGFFRRQKHGLLKGYIAGVLGRYFFSFLSGIIFFAAYAPDTMAAPVYSLLYNGSYLGAEAVITLAVIALPPVANGLEQIKRMAFEE